MSLYTPEKAKRGQQMHPAAVLSAMAVAVAAMAPANTHAPKLPVEGAASLTTKDPGQTTEPTGLLIYNVQTRRCVDIPYFDRGRLDNDTFQWLCRPGSDDNQQFSLVKLGKNGTYDRFLIKNLKSGYCLDLPDYGAPRAGAPVRQYHCRPDGDNQVFYRKTVKPDGSSFIVNEASGLCLNVEGVGNKALDAPLNLWPCSTKDDHLWRFQSPSTTRTDPLPTAPGEDVFARAVSFIADEMETNGQTIENQQYLWFYPALDKFYMQVKAGGPWDHKPIIRDRWFKGTIRGSQRYTPVPATPWALNYDFWSNIHYGYVGRKAGISPFALRKESTLNSFVPGSGVTDEGDNEAVEIGLDLAGRPDGHHPWVIEKVIREHLDGLGSLTDKSKTVLNRSSCRITSVSPCEGPWQANVMYHRESLQPGESLRVKVVTGTTTELIMQEDGNLVLYANLPNGQKHACWSSGSKGKAHYAVYESYGSLVLYDQDGRRVWWSLTEGHGSGNSTVSLNEFGSLWIADVKLVDACLG